jgi:hypothetical protein
MKKSTVSNAAGFEFPLSSNAVGGCIGLILLVVSALGIVHGVRTAVGQWLYRGAKYGPAREDPERVFEMLEIARGLDPRNYYACVFAEETAFHASVDENGRPREDLLRICRRWCERGLALNRYNRSLRLRWAGLLARKDIHGAIAYMREYVDWFFWHPHNHAVLAELYAKAGDFDKAQRELNLIDGMEYHGPAEESVADATAEFLNNLPDLRDDSP